MTWMDLLGVEFDNYCGNSGRKAVRGMRKSKEGCEMHRRLKNMHTVLTDTGDYQRHL